MDQIAGGKLFSRLLEKGNLGALAVRRPLSSEDAVAEGCTSMMLHESYVNADNSAIDADQAPNRFRLDNRAFGAFFAASIQADEIPHTEAGATTGIIERSGDGTTVVAQGREGQGFTHFTHVDATGSKVVSLELRSQEGGFSAKAVVVSPAEQYEESLAGDWNLA